MASLTNPIWLNACKEMLALLEPLSGVEDAERLRVQVEDKLGLFQAWVDGRLPLPEGDDRKALIHDVSRLYSAVRAIAQKTMPAETIPDLELPASSKRSSAPSNPR